MPKCRTRLSLQNSREKAMRKQTRILWLRRAIFAVFILVAYLLQNTPGFFPAIFGVRAYFLISLTVCLGLFERELTGAVFGAFAGALWDIAAPGGDGFYAILLMLIGMLCGILVNTIMRNNLITAMLLNLVAHLLYVSLYVVIFVLAAGVDSAGWLLVRYYLPSVLYSILFTPIVYLSVRAVMNRTRLRP